MYTLTLNIQLHDKDYRNGCPCLDTENDYCQFYGVSVPMNYASKNFGGYPRLKTCKESEAKMLTGKCKAIFEEWLFQKYLVSVDWFYKR